MPIGVFDIAMLVLIGLVAGVLGGMLGIGGSVVIVPALVILTVGRDWHSQHLFQASAMVVNVIISIPAAMKHRSKGAIRADLFKIVLPASMVAIVIGVAISNLVDGELLKRFFGMFLLLLAVTEATRFLPRRHGRPVDEPEPRVTIARAGTVGGVMGFFAGLLGIGGGLIAVPLAQRLCKVPLRHAIGVSAGVMAFTAMVGASLKVGTLDRHGDAVSLALLLAVFLGLGAVAGARVGASLTHSAPLNLVRGVFLGVLTLAGLRMVLG